MRVLSTMLVTACITFGQTRLPDGVIRYDKPGPTPSLWQYIKDQWGWIVLSRPFGKSVAFLVGVGDYEYIKPKLQYVSSDLRELREYLLNSAGFDSVYVAQDGAASADLVERYMFNELPNLLSKDDRLLFYFSGHGTDISGTGYMQFSKATTEYDRSQYLDVTRCETWSKRLPAKHVLFLLDACNSGLGYDAKAGEPNVDEELLNQFSGDGSRIVVTAGTGTERSFQVTEGNNQGYSVFTRAFLDAIRNTNSSSGFLTLDEVLAVAERQIASFSRGNPGRQMTPRKWQIPRQPGTDKGTFVFLNANVKRPSVPSPLQPYIAVTPKELESPGPTGSVSAPGKTGQARSGWTRYSGPYFSFDYPSDWTIDEDRRIVKLASPPGPGGRQSYLDFTPQPASQSVEYYLNEYANRQRMGAVATGGQIRFEREDRYVDQYAGKSVIGITEKSGARTIAQTTLMPVGRCGYLAGGSMANILDASETDKLWRQIMKQILDQLATSVQCP
jgi:hypothetical protein